MKFLFIIALIILSSCEVFKIGAGSSGIINPTQEHPLGAIYLFKAELDSSNYIGASEILIHANGKQMSAKERYDIFPFLEKISLKVKDKQIVYFNTDTLNTQAQSIKCSFDYLHTLTFTVKKSDKGWFISEIKE
jgi:hypothetical protein